MNHSIRRITSALVVAATRRVAAAVLGAALVVPGVSTSAIASEPPALIAISAGSAGSYNYAELTAIADAIGKQFDTKIRAIPFGNAVARATALKAGKSDFWMSCSAYFTAFEGIGDFAAKSWGPQSIRMLLLANRIANFSFATSADSPIDTVADIKGKKVSWVVGNSGINMQIEAYLAYAGLNTRDVTLVKFPGYVPSVRGLINGQVDVAMTANSSSVTQELAASPRGLKWIPMPHADTDAWQRVQARAPFVAPLTITGGPGLKEGESAEVGSYPCPTILSYASASEGDVYWFTKMIVESWDGYKNAIKSSPYWHVDKALESRFAVPYHAGAVKYFKEIGKWTDALEAHNAALVARDEVLQKAFAKAKAEFTGADDAFPEFWEARKSEALDSM